MRDKSWYRIGNFYYNQKMPGEQKPINNLLNPEIRNVKFINPLATAFVTEIEIHSFNEKNTLINIKIAPDEYKIFHEKLSEICLKLFQKNEYTCTPIYSCFEYHI